MHKLKQGVDRVVDRGLEHQTREQISQALGLVYVARHLDVQLVKPDHGVVHQTHEQLDVPNEALYEFLVFGELKSGSLAFLALPVVEAAVLLNAGL